MILISCGIKISDGYGGQFAGGDDVLHGFEQLGWGNSSGLGKIGAGGDRWVQHVEIEMQLDRIHSRG
jgi:hypothetical protein